MLLRYLEEDAELRPYLGTRPRDPKDLLARAPLNARRIVPPAQLASALADYARRHDAPDAVLASCRAIAEGAQVVVTGQQPALLGGPLYSLHKAATAVRLARELSAQPNAPKIVPLFWNHTDDHDLDEANRAFLVNANQDVQRLRIDLQRSGEPLRDIAVGSAMDQLLAAASDLLPNSEFREFAFDIFRPKHPDETLGAGLARMLFALFGEHGLVVVEPRDLPPPAFDVLGRWWEQTNAIHKQQRAVLDDLADAGEEITLDPGATAMFQHVGGRRLPLADGDATPRVSTLSPGVLLRPLWQDACLPSVASVVGPGELAYLAVAGPLYRQLGVPQPILVPRASLTLVEPSLAKLLHRFHWDLSDLTKGPDALAASLPGETGEHLEDVVDGLTESLKQSRGAIVTQVRQEDPQVLGAAERARQKTLEELEKLAQKLRNSRQNRQGTGLRQIRRLCSNLWPRERMQERVLPALPFLVSHGKELATAVLGAADPFATSHGVLEL